MPALSLPFPFTLHASTFRGRGPTQRLIRTRNRILPNKPEGVGREQTKSSLGVGEEWFVMFALCVVKPNRPSLLALLCADLSF